MIGVARGWTACGAEHRGRHARSGRPPGLRRVALCPRASAFHAVGEASQCALYVHRGPSSGIFNMDEYRHAIERMEPRHYLAAPYYERR